MDTMTTTLLGFRPSDERLEEIAQEIAVEDGEPHQTYSWVVSETLPPGHSVSEQDQLLAHQRDCPGSVFLTVLLED
jgi:hypothetical protein